ncbi:MAG: Fe-S protein assembly co-chaperone HscB [Rhodocyclaceae bacterium]|nr:Fe-S protein assembly co-chaperone HscB [Rhodocyclaceae bacterium]
MDFHQDYFALFNLPRRQTLDIHDLERRYQRIQATVHPDKHAHLGESERRLAMQLATKVNEAWLTLKHPGKRAAYLLQLLGHDVDIENNTVMPIDFLMRQMEAREAVMTARNQQNAPLLDELHRRIKNEIASQHIQLQQAIDERCDFLEAAGMVRALMFQDKLLHDIDEALIIIEE